jgi:hypothetical protein
MLERKLDMAKCYVARVVSRDPSRFVFYWTGEVRPDGGPRVTHLVSKAAQYESRDKLSQDIANLDKVRLAALSVVSLEIEEVGE